MSLKKVLIGAVMLSGLAGVPAHSATLSGDNVTVTIGPVAPTIASGNVGAGTDIQIGAALFDFNFGVDGDEFQLTANSGPFSSFNQGAGSAMTISLTSLDFLGGENLVGFINLVSIFANTSFVFTNNSITFSMTDGSNGPGVLLSGKFVTAPEVPIPAALPLFAAGLGAMGFMGWRKRRKAA